MKKEKRCIKASWYTEKCERKKANFSCWNVERWRVKRKKKKKKKKKKRRRRRR